MTKLIPYEETREYQKWKARQERKAKREEQERADMINRVKKYTEKQVDNAFVKCVEEAKAFTTKMHPVTQAGIPDRILHFQNRTCYVEMKATGEQCTPLQIEMHKRLKAQNIEVYVLDTKIKNLLDLYTVCYTTYEGHHYKKNPHR